MAAERRSPDAIRETRHLSFPGLRPGYRRHPSPHRFGLGAMKIPAYYGFWHHLGNWLLKVSSWLVLLFLILPILVIVPLSFNAEPFFSFTEGMLTLDPEAYSLRWYREIFNDPKWILAIKNSFFIGILSTVLATILGTCAAVGR
jgi:putative spermidine/putrescine transport system permease protein